MFGIQLFDDNVPNWNKRSRWGKRGAGFAMSVWEQGPGTLQGAEQTVYDANSKPHLKCFEGPEWVYYSPGGSISGSYPSPHYTRGTEVEGQTHVDACEAAESRDISCVLEG